RFRVRHVVCPRRAPRHPAGHSYQAERRGRKDDGRCAVRTADHRDGAGAAVDFPDRAARAHARRVRALVESHQGRGAEARALSGDASQVRRLRYYVARRPRYRVSVTAYSPAIFLRNVFSWALLLRHFIWDDLPGRFTWDASSGTVHLGRFIWGGLPDSLPK